MSRMREVPTEGTACPNCGEPLRGVFCARCGQKAGAVNPTFHDFMHDAVHELLHVDGRIFRSVRQLLLRPGFLSREYFAGRRAPYLTALRLYLIFSVGYFALAAFATTPSAVVVITANPDRPGTDISAELRQLGFESGEQVGQAVIEAMGHWVPRAMFVLVPLFGALLMLLLRRSHRNYPLHLVFALHVHAAWFAVAAMVVAVGTLAIEAVSGAAFTIGVAYAMWYLVWAIRSAYATTTAGALWRAAVVTGLYGIAVGIALSAIALAAIFMRR